MKAARASARAAVWAAGGAPGAGERLVLDVDASISVDHSDRKENAAATWKRTFGFHTLLVFADRPEIAGGEALAGKLRPGNAGSGTTCDHVEVLKRLWSRSRWVPAEPGRPLRATDSGAVRFRWCHLRFAEVCRQQGVGFSFGFAVKWPVERSVGRRSLVGLPGRHRRLVPDDHADGTIRDGAWVAEATGLLDLSAWPTGSRVILRKERPHPGAQLTFTDVDGHRVTAFITDTPAGVVPGQFGGLDLRHRQHARVEDRIRQAKATGMRNFPCHLRRSQQRLVGDRADRDRPRGLDQTPRLRRRTGPRQLRDRDLPLPGAARRRPDHPRRPSNQAPYRRHLAMVRHRAVTGACRLWADRRSTVDAAAIRRRRRRPNRCAGAIADAVERDRRDRWAGLGGRSVAVSGFARIRTW